MDNKERLKESERLDLKRVEEYFSARGYQVVKLEQPWRHVTGVLRKDNKDLFLKLASTPTIAERTKNEFAWNNLANSLSQEQRLPVSIPQNYESGMFQELFWFLSSHAGEKLLSRPVDKDQTKDLEDNLPAIAKTAYQIINIKTPKRLPIDKTLNIKQRQEKLLKLVKEWASQTSEDVTDLTTFIEDKLDTIQIAPSHGDFVPWHFVLGANKTLSLVDGEHAHIRGLKFYDVAYFYHRVWTKLKRPDIAERFLAEFQNLYRLLAKEKDLFRLILAQRIIGGFFNITRGSVFISVELQRQLKDKLIGGLI